MIKHVVFGAALALATVASSTAGSAQTTISNAAGRSVQIFYTPGSFDAPYETTASAFRSFGEVGQEFGDGVVVRTGRDANLPSSLFPTNLKITAPESTRRPRDGVASFAVNDARLFSFVIGSIHSSNSIQLTFQDDTTLLLEGLELIGNLGRYGTSGRVTYDFGSALNNALTRIDFIASNSNTTRSFSAMGEMSTMGSSGHHGGDKDKDKDWDKHKKGEPFYVTAMTTAAPEPATWAMMIFGFGAAGAALRRRQRVHVRFA